MIDFYDMGTLIVDVMGWLFLVTMLVLGFGIGLLVGLGKGDKK
jgi:hypothetical protein